MSNRFYEFDKGSSRSTRDDSRTHSRERERRDEHKSRDRDSHKSRSRSPRRRHSPPSRSSKSRYSKDSSRSRDEDDKRSKSPVWQTNEESDEDVPAPPPPPRISKISIGFSKPNAPIKMNLSGPAKPTPALKPSVASVFNVDDDDDDDEPEEMPAEAKMRMRNIGRETPTSAGPNSFGKTKQGFCDAKKVFEKNLKEALDTADKKKPIMTKFPQTIYRIKGP